MPADPSAPIPAAARSTRVYEGRVVSLRLDEFDLPDGRVLKHEVVEHKGAVAIVALADDSRVLLIRQWRHAVGEWLHEIPAGTLEPGEAPEACARRELIEETGFAADSVAPLVSFYTSPGFTTELLHVFLAQDLTPAHGDQDEDERIEVVPVPWREALAMCRDGRIKDAKTIAGLFSAARVLGR
jgi:ADP-ribose diphosphatase